MSDIVAECAYCLEKIKFKDTYFHKGDVALCVNCKRLGRLLETNNPELLETNNPYKEIERLNDKIDVLEGERDHAWQIMEEMVEEVERKLLETNNQELLETNNSEKCRRFIDMREDEVPQSQCPKCKKWVDDHDGFGVLAHDECGYCSHPSSQGDDTGRMICDICGKDVS